MSAHSSIQRRASLFALLSLALSSAAYTHPGGLNKAGCHNDRKNGGYHCHRSAAAPSYNAPRSGLQPARLSPASAATNATPAYGGGRVFRNCDEARAAGAAPVRRGEPGYGQHLDRDNDGVGCEPYRGR